MTEREPWLGHRDLCSIQWSGYCDCGVVAVEVVDEVGRTYVFNGDEADEVWTDRP